MTTNLIIQLIVAFASGSSFFTVLRWISNRKKRNVEAVGLEINNAQAAVNMWRELVEELRGSLDRQEAQVNRLTQQCEWMKRELATVLKENEALKQRLVDLQSKNLYQ